MGARARPARALNTWTHIAATYDGTTIRLFVNGVQAATRAQTGALLASTQPLRFGGNALWAEWFQGQLDEIRVYNRALTGDRDPDRHGEADHATVGAISPVSDTLQSMRRNRSSPAREPTGPCCCWSRTTRSTRPWRCAMLEQSGLRVDVVRARPAALDAVADKPYDAVLMDCQMPVMDGYAATAELRRREDDDEHLPDHRADRPRVRRRARALPGRGDGRLPRQARSRGRARCRARAPRRAAALDPRGRDAAAAAVGSEALVAQILNLFVAQATTYLETIGSAIAASDTDRRSAHGAHAQGQRRRRSAPPRSPAPRPSSRHGDLGAAERLRDAVERTRTQRK